MDATQEAKVYRDQTANRAPQPRPASQMQSISSDLATLNSRAAEILNVLRQVLERAHGPAPQEGESDLKSVPNGVLGELRERTERLDKTFGRIESCLEVLEQFV